MVRHHHVFAVRHVTASDAKKHFQYIRGVFDVVNDEWNNSSLLPLRRDARQKEVVASAIAAIDDINTNTNNNISNSNNSSNKNDGYDYGSDEDNDIDISTSTSTRRRHQLRRQSEQDDNDDVDVDGVGGVTDETVQSKQIFSISARRGRVLVGLAANRSNEQRKRPYNSRITNRSKRERLAVQSAVRRISNVDGSDDSDVDDDDDEDEDEGIEQSCSLDDVPCEVCGSAEDSEHTLLCDQCDKAYHMSCLRPPLRVVPRGDWFCSTCQTHFNRKRLSVTAAPVTLSSSMKQLDSLSITRNHKELQPTIVDSLESKDGCSLNDVPCEVCGSSQDSERTLLCDRCDEAYHMYCLRPPIRTVPSGDWFCAPCQSLVNGEKKNRKPATYASSSSKKGNSCSLDDAPCEVCGSVDDGEHTLLCDQCDKAYHMDCLRPPLRVVPQGNWFCKSCQTRLNRKKLDGEAPLQKNLYPDEIEKENLPYPVDKRKRKTITPVTAISDASPLVRGGRHDRRALDKQHAGLEEYFQSHDPRLRISSNKGAESIPSIQRAPQMDESKLKEMLECAAPKYPEAHVRLNSTVRNEFGRWWAELNAGFNVLLYGWGSKREILLDFVDQQIMEQPHVIVNGYHPTCCAKELLDEICSGFFGHSGTFRSLVDQCDWVKRAFSTSLPLEELVASSTVPVELFIIFHSIDGPNLRAEKTQDLLSALAAIPQVRMLATIDHINAPLLWSYGRASQFGWLWHDATTFSAYAYEMSFENSLMVRNKRLGTRGILFVLRSLTSNARSVFTVLARHQIDHAETLAAVAASGGRGSGSSWENKAGANTGALPLQLLYQRCRQRMLVSSMPALRAHLTEFRDHEILKSIKVDGVEHVHIPVERSELEHVLSSLAEDEAS